MVVTIGDDKSLNERIQRHPMKKPKSRLMQVSCEQGNVLSWDGHKGLDQMNWMLDKNVDDELTFD